mmetsp:Transcript_76935/g.124483  ORF Transcript_76935/g.124483 Transcript_76935/m.124483 type:complete len:271 (-) Transcript_76935:1214-2026(-)
MRLTSTMPAMPMNAKNMRPVSGALYMIGLTKEAQLSKVISWNNVNIVISRSPNRYSTTSSSWKSSDFVMVSMIATANTKCTVPMITKDQKSSLVHSIMPLTNIHSSLKKPLVRTALAKRASRRTLRVPKRRRRLISKPTGSKIHRTRTPVTHTTKVSKQFMGWKTQTHVSAVIRRHHSRTKMKTKRFSPSVITMDLSSPFPYIASAPDTIELRPIQAPNTQSKRSECTIFLRMGYAGVSSSDLICCLAILTRNARIPSADWHLTPQDQCS